MNDQPSSTEASPILVAGGDADSNLASLLACLQQRGVPHEALLVGTNSHPRVTWDLDADVLRINGEARRPKAVFIRHDVFTSLATGRPEPAKRALSWFTTVFGWAFAHPDVRLLNRASGLNITNKPQVLHLARQVGFAIPSTLVTNNHDLLSREVKERALIVKPVNGGEYTRMLEDILAIAPVIDNNLSAPAIVQECLVPPEIRVYGLNGRFFPYQLVADALDYRTRADCEVVPLETTDLPDGLTDCLAALMDRLQLDFGAADFKACPETGQLRFLEINNGPMFAAFDAVSEARLTNAMVDFLSS